MRIIFVRHGEPNYQLDRLTATGRAQATAVAARLVPERIDRIYTSPNGRAQETASFTAQALKLPIITLDYMHEISWGGEGIPAEGHPWTLSDWMLDREASPLTSWREHPYFRNNIATSYYDRVTTQFDALLAEYGYRHEGRHFHCTPGSNDTIAIFSHGGSGACVLSHLLGLPFPYVCGILTYDFTSVTIVSLPVLPQETVHPHLDLFNDCAHLHQGSQMPALQEKPDNDTSPL